MQPDSIPPTAGVHWIVRMNWKNRSICFVLLALTVASHMADRQPGPIAWLLLVLQFMVYPQVLYLLTRRLPQQRQRQVEVRNMLLDGLGFGLWCSFLGLPLWITFTMYIGVSMNLLVFESFRGWVQATLCMALGIAVMHGLRPTPWQADTSLLTTGLSMFTLGLYILAFAYDAYLRATSLHRHRAQLRQQLEANHRLQAQLTELALRDPLTGLYNRRHLDETMQLQLQRCAVMGSGAAVLLLDIDHFKQINDRHGHAVGDQLLQTLAQLLLRNCRAGDTACRYGGDEFLLLLTEVTPDAALARAQQLRQEFAVQQLRVEDQSLSTTLSCGLALFPAHGTEPARLIQRADQALYQAKLHGRNAVVVFEHHLETCTDGAK